MATNPPIHWQQIPPATTRHYVPILSPKAGGKVRILVLSDAIEGVWTHFLDGRTTPCIGEACGCAGCLAGRGRRWKGYLAGTVPETEELALAEVTARAALPHAERLQGANPGIRGYGVTVRRAGSARNGKLEIEFSLTRREPDELPRAPDVRWLLSRVWGTMVARPATFDDASQPELDFG